jgi:hypothetical protein
MTTSELVPTKVQDRLASSRLLNADETVLAYVNGSSVSPRVKALGGVLLLPLILHTFRGIALTDRNLYVCRTKFAGAGAVKSIVSTYARGSFVATLDEARAGMQLLLVEGEKLYVPSRGWMFESAKAIVAAGNAAGSAA